MAIISRVAVVAMALCIAVVLAGDKNIPVELPASKIAKNFQDTQSMPTFHLVESTDATKVKKVYALGKAPTNTKLLGVGQYNNSHAEIGWDYLMVEPKEEDKGELEGYLNGGILEGYLTYPVMSYAVADYFKSVTELSADVQAFLKEQYKFVTSNAEKAQSTDKDQYWFQIKKLLAQLNGISQGYNEAAKEKGTQVINEEELFNLNVISYELGDIQLAVTNGNFTPPSGMGSHCSALIKILPNDLYMSHDTWAGYVGMVRRIFKVYRFETTVTLSSFPGYIASGDDWYQTTKQLAVMETTNFVFNTSLYNATVPQTVPEFMRVMGANFVANGGEEWTTFFARYNSGTYNNQYMVVDFKLYTPGQPLVKNTLWVAEQIPGYVEKADQTSVLESQGYWASYNIAFYQHIYNISGYREMLEKQGTIWSYTEYARPQIFKRHQGSIKNIDQMKTMMRFNHYEDDILSKIPNCKGTPGGKCTPENSAMLTIASRGDLNPPKNESHYGPTVAWVDQTFGAIDSKIALWSNRFNLRPYVINGPTYDNQPVFNWSTSPYPNTKPKDAVDSYRFPWVEFTNIVSGANSAPEKPSTKISPVAMGIAGGIGIVILLSIFTILNWHDEKMCFAKKRGGEAAPLNANAV